MKKILLIWCGILFTIIGTLGIFIPLLPTTPFLLLAATCFYNSSEKLHYWLLNNKILGNYISDYINKRGMPIKVKAFTLILLWSSISYAFIFATTIIYVRVLLVIIAASVSVHILSIKTKKSNK